MNLFERLRRPSPKHECDELIRSLCFAKVERDFSDACVRYFHTLPRSEPLPSTHIPCRIQISHTNLPTFPGELIRHEVFATLKILTTDFPALVTDQHVISIEGIEEKELEEAETTFAKQKRLAILKDIGEQLSVI